MLTTARHDCSLPPSAPDRVLGSACGGFGHFERLAEGGIRLRARFLCDLQPLPSVDDF